MTVGSVMTRYATNKIWRSFDFTPDVLKAAVDTAMFHLACTLHFSREAAQYQLLENNKDRRSKRLFLPIDGWIIFEYLRVFIGITDANVASKKLGSDRN